MCVNQRGAGNWDGNMGITSGEQASNWDRVNIAHYVQCIVVCTKTILASDVFHFPSWPFLAVLTLRRLKPYVYRNREEGALSINRREFKVESWKLFFLRKRFKLNVRFFISTLKNYQHNLLLSTLIYLKITL